MNTDELWLINGVYYDFSSFVERHPGGRSNILLGRGRDCTELFKSVHLFGVDSKILSKYEVGRGQPGQFDWAAPFQAELLKCVKLYFRSRNKSHKAPLSFWIIQAALAPIMLFSLSKTIAGCGVIYPIITGILITNYAFNILHTGSHSALSHHPWVDWLLFVSTSNLTGWFHTFWLQHHVFGHHSYTGILGHDPDTTNFPQSIVRIHHETAHQPAHRYGFILQLIILLALPGQYLIQSYSYFTGALWGSVFGMRIYNFGLLDSFIMSIMTSCWIYTLVIADLRSMLLMYVVLGILYWAFVITNHEYGNSTKSADWAIHQIANSSNFEASAWLTFIIGGMNYQIEHHLFPTVHPAHYPELSKIVKAMCSEHKIPYLCYSSWLDAAKAHFKLMYQLANGKK